MQNKKYHIIGTVPKFNRKIVETEEEIDTSNMTAHFPGLVHAFR